MAKAEGALASRSDELKALLEAKKTFAEIAQILGVSKSTVAGALSRLRINGDLPTTISPKLLGGAKAVIAARKRSCDAAKAASPPLPRKPRGNAKIWPKTLAAPDPKPIIPADSAPVASIAPANPPPPPVPFATQVVRPASPKPKGLRSCQWATELPGAPAGQRWRYCDEACETIYCERHAGLAFIRKAS